MGKRNRQTVKMGRLAKAEGRSRYASKVSRGDQMYGPGCCAHKVTRNQIEDARERARHEGHRLESQPFHASREDEHAY